MKVLTVAAGKGGTGKTTTAVSIAGVLAEQGKRVLVIDLDSQGTATTYLGAKAEGRALLDLFLEGGSLADIVKPSCVEGVDIVPASIALARAETLAQEPGAQAILRERVRELPAKRWDFVVVDTPPGLGFLFISGLVAADAVVVPVEASTTAVGTLDGFLRTLDNVRRLNPTLALAGLLLCRTDSRARLSADLHAHLRETYGDRVFSAVVRDTVRLREAWSHSQPITRYDGRGIGAADYRAATAELVERLG